MNKKKSHPRSDTYHILSGWLIDGTGGPILTEAILSVSDGIINSVKRKGFLEVNSDNIIDFSHCTLLPGLVDSHVHLSMSGVHNPEIRKRQLIAPFKEIKEVISGHLEDQLKCGVVALRDGGDHAGHTLRYRLEYLPRTAFPISCLIAGKAWHAEGRYGRIIGRPPLKGQNLSQSISVDHDSIDHIKIVNSGLNSLSCFGRETLPQFSLKDLSEAVRVGNALGLKTMVHANGRKAVRLAIESGCHSIEHGYFMGDENLMRMADKQVTWVPTLYPMEAYLRASDPGSPESEVTEKNLYHQIDQVSRALKYGVPIAVGTDSGSPGVNHGSAIMEEVRLLLSAGISLEQAVGCATMNGARLLEIEYHTGRLTSGMPATFLAVPGRPEGLTITPGSLEALFVKGREYVRQDQQARPNAIG
ncbi:amidohydrolase family protein [Deltaproteobacteria bacterium]|nr:amidohydrolase family protein [Deltaproteobacteria bacterium]